MIQNYNSSRNSVLLLETLQQDTGSREAGRVTPLGKMIAGWMLFLAFFLFAGSNIYAQVSVSATAGTATGSYATVNAAFTAINAGTHKGVIVLTVAANTTEPATPVQLLKSGSAGGSSYTSIKIVPSGNVTINSAATPTSNRGVLEFLGADNVTIDGDDTATAGTQNLSIVVATSANTPAAIRIASNSTTGTDGADNITIKNCNITGSRSSATSTTTSYGIAFTDATFTAGAYSSINTVIDNNIITRCYHGVYANGASTTYPLNGLQIKNNTFGSATAANNIGFRAIFLAYTSATAANAAIVENNDIRVGDVSASGSGYSLSIAGIEISSGNVGTIIRRNNIHDVMNPSTSGYGAFGITFSSSTSTSGTDIQNNFIRDIVASKYSTTITSSFENYGIYISAGITGIKIKHNTIALLTANSTGTTANSTSACIMLTSTAATISELYNNILLNNNTSTQAFGIYTSATANITNSNNNNFYIPNGSVGYYNAATRSTLNAWKTATSKDAASLNVNPSFTSATDLHIPAGTVTLLESGGATTATTSITTDYDGQARPGPAGSTNGGGTAPDIGADEFDGKAQTCYPVASLSGVATAYNTANLTWTAPSSGTLPTSYEYAVTTSATPPASGTSTSATSVTGYSGLNGNTTYYLHVRSFCGGSDYSGWTTSASFTTPCQPLALPVSEGFNSASRPLCWSEQFVSGTLSFTYPTTGTGTPSPAPYEGTNQVMYNSYSNSTKTRLVSAPITSVGTASVDVSFYWYNYATGALTTYPTEGVTLQYSTDGTNWTSVGSQIPRYAATSGWVNKLVTLPAGAGNQASLYIGFLFEGNAGYDCYLDNVVVSASLSCYVPGGLAATSNGSNLSANISWSAPSNGPVPSGYEYAISTSSTPPASGIAVTGTSTASAPGSVAINQTHYLHVRSNCDTGGYSSWATISFAGPPVTAIASGDFASGANWNDGVGPVCGQAVVIPNGVSMTMTSGTASVAGLTIQAGGSLAISATGAITVGCTNNNSTVSNSGTLTVSGGTLTVNGNIFNATGSTFNQSGGAIIIDGNNNGSATGSVASGTPLLGFGTSSVSFATGTISLTGGTLTIVDPHTASTNTSAYALYAYLSSGVNFNAAVAHTLNFGDGVSTQSGNNTSGFYWNAYASASGRLNLGTVVINNPSGTNRIVTQTGTNAINGNFTVTAGTYDQGTNTLSIGGNVSVGNGATWLTGTGSGGAVIFGSTTGITTGVQTVTQSVSVSGTGAIRISTSTANFYSVSFQNSSAGGVVINDLNQASGNAQVAANALNSITFNSKVTTNGGKALLYGTPTARGTGSLTITSGGMAPGSAFAIGTTAAQTGSTITANAIPTTTAQYPLLDASGNARHAWVQRATPTATGIISITYTDASGVSDVSIADGAYTVEKRTNGKWTVSTLGTTPSATTFNLALSAPNVFSNSVIASSNARIVTASSVLGTHQAGTTLPHAQRTGLTLAQLTGNDYYVGINSGELIFQSIATGNWNEGTTWNKGTVPTATDVVQIMSGHTVTVDGSYTAASSNLTINSGGTLAVSANTLALGSITNAGTVNLTGGAITTTTTATNSGTLNMSGGTMTTTTALTNNSGGNLNLSAGTLAVTTTYTNAGTFTGTGGTLNVTGGSATGITNSGTFVVNGVTANLGTAANVNDRTFSSTGTLTVTTGTLNINGNMTASSGTFNHTGGNINIDGNGSTSSVASGTYLLNITTSNVNWTGGTTTIVDPHASGSYAFYYSGSTASNLTTGTHTLRLGDGVSTTAGNTTYGFYLYTYGSTRFTFRNLEVNGGSAAGRFTYTLYGFGVNGDLTINANSEYRDAGTITYVAGNVVNNGTYTNTGALYMGTFISGTAGASTSAQTISGSGTWRNSTTATTASMAGFTVNNTNATGVTLSVPLSVSGTLTLTAGKVNTTSANLLTLGTATAAGTLSGGSTTAYIDGPFARTFAASRTASGTYSTTTLFPVGKGTAYLPLYVDPSTSAGGAIGIKGEAFTSNAGTMGTSVTSLAANRWEAIPTNGAANLTNAFVRLGDAAATNTSKILQSASAAGSYEALPMSIIYGSATPNTLTTQTAIDGASYLGYFSHGNLNSCTAPATQPTGFTISALTTTTLTASFTAASGGASHYLVVAYPAGSTPTAPADYATPTAASLGTGAIILYSNSGVSFTGTGLVANTSYDVYVYSYNNAGCYGPVFNTTLPLTANFTTCSANTNAPGTPTLSSVSDTTLNVAWTASSTASVNYILEVATNSSFTSYVSGYNNVSVGSALTATISGLTANTTYYVRVRAAVGSCYSTNIAYLTATTSCTTVTAFTQNFDAGTTFPSCWAKVGSNGTANIQASSSQSSPNCLYMYSSATTSRAVVSMPPVSNAGANTHWLRFSYRANFTVGETIEVGYLTNPIDASTFVPVTSVTTTSTTAYTSATVDLGTAPGANTVLAFRTGTATYSVLIDDVVWEVKPTCYPPTAISASAISTTGATIGWTAPVNGSPASYEYEVRTSGAAGSGSSGMAAFGTVTAPAVSAVVTGLSPATVYTVYVRTFCGGSDYSTWTTGYTFTTACNVITALPHSESFDAAALPVCWSTSGTGTWAPDDANDSASASRSGSRFAGLAWTGDNLDAYLISPAYNLTSDPRAARINVWIYRGSSGLSSDKIVLYVSTTTSVTGATQLLDVPLLYTSAPTETASGWYNYTAAIPNSFITGGDFYIIAKGTITSSFSSYSLAMDDYKLEYRPTAITSFTPATVCSQDSQTVTLTGRNFTGASAVKFNGVDAASYTVVNNTTITAVTPLGVTTGNITVTTPLNTATSGTALSVTNNPTVADITGGGVSMCTGSSIMLTSSPAGGTWSTSDAAIASVDASGNVIGVAAGTVTMSYTVTAGGCSTTKTTTITVNQAVSITSFTPTQTVTPGASAHYTVAASGTGLTYQWEISTNGGASYSALSNDAVYSGVTTSSLTVSGVDMSMNHYKFRVAVSGASPCASVTSTEAILNVSNVGITSHPAPVTLCTSGAGTAQFSVVGTGEELTYQWFEVISGVGTPITNGTLSGVTYAGQGTNTLSLSGLSAANNGYQYYVLITDAASAEATSNAAVLTVNTAVAISAQPSNATVCSTGGTTNFTVAATGSGLGYQWQYATSASGPWSNVSNATPTGATYSGATTNTLSVTTTSATPSAAMYYYRAVVTGASPCGSSVTDAASLSINAPAISSQPTATTVVAGGTATLTVATTAPGATYQWQYSANGTSGWTNVIDATPSAVTYTGTTAAALGIAAGNTVAAGSHYYRVIVTSNGCTVTSNAVQLTIATYCNPSPTSVDGSGITNVVLGSINNPSTVETNNYGNYTNLSANVYQSQTVNFTITYSTGYTYGTKVWVDWNNNGLFTDSGELMYTGLSTNANPTTLSGSFTVPASAIVGNHRVRIGGTDTDSGPSTPCYTGTFGSFEDYTINVQQLNTPIISGFTPSSYCAANGVLTINGSNFQLSSVKVGSTTISPITINAASTQITATVASGISGVVSVTNAAGTATTTETFSVTAPPAFALSGSSAIICPGSSTPAVTIATGADVYNSYTVTSVPSGAAFTGNSTSGFVFNPAANTVYTVTATNGTCTTSATYTVSLASAPSAVTVAAVTSPSGSDACTNDYTALTASGGTLTNVGIMSQNFNLLAVGAEPSGWTVSEPVATTSWGAAAATLAGGTANEMKLDATNSGTSDTGSWTLTTAAISTAGYSSASLSFRHYYSQFSTNQSTYPQAISVQTSIDGTTWVDRWNVTPTASIAATPVTVDLSAVANKATVYIRFKFTGKPFGMYNWSIDDVAVTGTAASSITWSPATGLYTDTALTTPYVSGSAATVVYAVPNGSQIYTATATGGNGCTSTGSVGVVHNGKRYVGTDTTWATDGNWFPAGVPTDINCVTIPAAKAVVVSTAGAEAGSLTIAAGASVTVISGNALTVENAVNVNATGAMTLQNNAHLLQGTATTSNSNTGSIVVKRNSSPLYRQDYTMWASPVAAQNLLAFSPNTLSTRFYTFNTAANAFAAVASPGATSFEPGRGYLIRMPNGAFAADGTTPTGTFTTTAAAYQGGSSTMTYNGQFGGVPNNGNISVTLSTAGTAPNEGFNLVGNPYPSPISITALFGANTGTIDGYIYIWRKKNAENVSSAYCTVNASGDFVTNGQEGASDPNGIIQTGQGFIVKASSASNLVFNNAMRSESTTNDASFFRMSNTQTPEPIENHRIWLNLNDATHHVAQMMVGYKSNATMDVDPMIDAPFINDSQTGLNSIINGSAYAIQGRSLPFDVNDEVPLQFKAATAGNFTISIDHVDGLFMGDQDIYLKDYLTGAIHDLKAASYSFETTAGSFNDRFSVIYVDSALGTDNPVLDANSIVIYKNDGKLHINTGTATMKNVTIFDIRGRLVYSKDSINASSVVISDLHVEEQMLIVKVTTTDNATASKKVVY